MYKIALITSNGGYDLIDGLLYDTLKEADIERIYHQPDFMDRIIILNEKSKEVEYSEK